MEKDEAVNIVFITDKNYAMPTGVAIESLYVNKLESSKYNIFVLCKGLDENIKLKFVMKNDDSFNVVIKDIKDNEIFSNIKHPGGHVSLTALYKFLLPTIFSELDKILYLDGDIFVQKDLKELYDINIDNYYIAAVADIGPMVLYKPNILTRLAIDNEEYFNSGVMLLNLKLMRNDNVENSLINYLENPLNTLMDQDALNVVLGASLKSIHPKYNNLTTMHNRLTAVQISEFYDIDINKIGKYFLNDVNIIHCASPVKPWISYINDLSDLFLKYHSTSSFSDIEINFIEHSKETEVAKKKYSDYTFFEKIFSVKNEYLENNIIFKVICMFGLKIKIRCKRLEYKRQQEHKLNMALDKISLLSRKITILKNKISALEENISSNK